MNKGKNTEIIEVSAKKLLARAKELVQVMGENFFELGEVLHTIKEQELYKDEAIGSWAEYVSAELDFELGKADHYVEIWGRLSRHGIGWNEVKHIGWSRLSRVVRKIETKGDAKHWLRLAEKHSRRELEVLVRERTLEDNGGLPPLARGDRVSHDVQGELAGVHETVDGPVVDQRAILHDEINPDVLGVEEVVDGKGRPLHKFQVYMFQEGWSQAMAAMERAGQLANTDRACDLLELICNEFNTTYAETEDGGVAQRLEWHVKNLERIFGIKVSVEVPRESTLRKMSRLDTKPEAVEESPKPGRGKGKGKAKTEHRW